jgi:glycine hydroxymethyltransferase
MKAMGQGMVAGGLRLVTGGTDNHLALVDLSAADVTGKDAEGMLERVGITANKNSIPNETRSPFVASGIRVGSAAMTTRGFREEEARETGPLIARAIFERNDSKALAKVRERVAELLAAHPLYPELP